VLRRRRTQAGLSQQALAERAGLERSYLSLLEAGKRMPGVEVVFRLAVGLEVSPLTLFSEVEEAWRRDGEE
jgi:transcriptional regulator with XRE-family HTH domain